MSESTEKDDKLNMVVDHARLLEVMLTSALFNVSHDFADENEASDKFIDDDVISSQYDHSTESAVGYLRCRLWMNRASDKTAETKPSLEEAIEKSVFAVDATYFIAFSLAGSHSEEDVKSFFKRTAPFTAWPYFRSLVAQLASAANYEIPVLPIRRVLVPFRAGGGYSTLRRSDLTSER